LFQAYNDIVYVQRWTNPEVIDLEKCKRGAIKATKKGADAFAELSSPQEIYLAITSDDASLVYYKISDGIVKPQL